jgi:hypothetical protein
MKWFVIGFALAGVALLITGWRATKSPDPIVAGSSFIAMVAGIACFVLGIGVLIAWGVSVLLLS